MEAIIFASDMVPNVHLAAHTRPSAAVTPRRGADYHLHKRGCSIHGAGSLGRAKLLQETVRCRKSPSCKECFDATVAVRSARAA
eukprot:scaffold1341_cov254-Prasinococcus_capsulatus_cf.AAC.2